MKQTGVQGNRKLFRQADKNAARRGNYADRQTGMQRQEGMQADRKAVFRGDRQTGVQGGSKISRQADSGEGSQEDYQTQTLVEGVRKINRLEDRNVVGSGGMQTII